MVFDVFPAPPTAPLDLAPLQESGLIPFVERIGVDPATGNDAMFIRVVKLGAGGAPSGPPHPTFRLKADAGDAVEVRETTTSIFTEAQAEVATARRFVEPGDVYFIRVLIFQRGVSWQLQIVNRDPATPHGFTWVVADSDAQARQPWIDAPVSLELEALAANEQAGTVQVANRGTGPLAIADPAGADLGLGFRLTRVPGPIAPNTRGELEVTFTAPDTPTGAVIRTTYTVSSNDSTALLTAEHNRRIALSATVHPSRVLTLAKSVKQVAQTSRGTVFAWGEGGLFRSDDAGLTWRELTTPPAPSIIAIDPSDEGNLFAASGSQVHKTTNGGTTWTPVLTANGLRVLAVTVSPADRNVVFVELAQSNQSLDLHRSLDGGASWTAIETQAGAQLATFRVDLLAPHPSDATRVFRSSGCYAGRDNLFGDTVDQSRDQGRTWTAGFRPGTLFANLLVGGAGSQPKRWYLGARAAVPPGKGKLFRSDDDGATWSEILASASGSFVVGAAYDPRSPDLVFAAVSPGTVRRSDDAGASWRDLPPDLPQVGALLLTQRSDALLAATVQGVWRINV